MKKNLETPPEQSVMDFLTRALISANKEKPIPSQDLCLMIKIRFGLKFKYSTSLLRQVINRLRCNEYPILANNKGYYISYDTDNISNQIDSLKNRMYAIEESIMGLERLHKRILLGK